MKALEANNFLENKTLLEFFAGWLEKAKKTSLKQPEAFTLSTVNKSGQPHSRILLLKEIRANELVFYTNYTSQKGQELEQHPKAAMNFFWDPLALQVCMQGTVTKTTRADSEKYWALRPRMSQLSQWTSKQSQEVSSREVMEQEFALVEKKFAGKEVPCPTHWGGYLFSPTLVEFWIGRDGRFHDRYSYQKVEGTWLGKRLYP
ncbi:MAG: pyridoxamine 5'-phosphate oxidase [Bdellovibrionales bacterium]